MPLGAGRFQTCRRAVRASAIPSVKPMNLKNYTSEVPASITVARIEQRLAQIGAAHINKLFGPNGRVISLMFGMPEGNRIISIKLPANVHACFEAMLAQKSRKYAVDKARLMEQAERTAWKLMQDWIEVQASLIQMKQAEAMQVFLPYAWDGKQTYFEAVKGGGFKALPESTE